MFIWITERKVRVIKLIFEVEACLKYFNIIGDTNNLTNIKEHMLFTTSKISSQIQR